MASLSFRQSERRLPNVDNLAELPAILHERRYVGVNIEDVDTPGLGVAIDCEALSGKVDFKSLNSFFSNLKFPGRFVLWDEVVSEGFGSSNYPLWSAAFLHGFQYGFWSSLCAQYIEMRVVGNSTCTFSEFNHNDVLIKTL